MALFEYTCDKCGSAFEKIIRSTRKTQRVACPSCGSVKVKRRMSRISAARGGGDNGAAACSPSGG